MAQSQQRSRPTRSCCTRWNRRNALCSKSSCSQMISNTACRYTCFAVVFLPASCCYSDSHNPLVLQATRVTVVNRIPIKEDRKGVVYAVTSPLLNAIKIGHWNASTHSLDAQCRKFYGHDIQMITATTSTPKRLEEHLHRQVAEHHLSGSLYDKSMVDAIFRTVRNPE